MNHNVTRDMATVIKGLGIAFGECIFGVYGPFLFNRFGFNDPASAIFGVMSGAAIGYGVTATALHFYRHEPATWHLGHRVSPGGWLHAHLHG